ncbi:hypothetical protein IE077_002006 [Cardiosporidium cionae]|uniref:Conserved oligomeric Golgi complex subunit 6 n=1 Tax=Cardiosporidium cionae TaxID=476202 RepID=A0ABQ7JBR7_9APIC|nr:hypothetical protein IE077_002006 [Cardiosporidium cionae]|eukprot:KAF8821453.1 hypothetical protein IE077_002006 [Cardiosporidium cionae]
MADIPARNNFPKSSTLILPTKSATTPSSLGAPSPQLLGPAATATANVNISESPDRSHGRLSSATSVSSKEDRRSLLQNVEPAVGPLLPKIERVVSLNFTHASLISAINAISDVCDVNTLENRRLLKSNVKHWQIESNEKLVEAASPLVTLLDSMKATMQSIEMECVHASDALQTCKESIAPILQRANQLYIERSHLHSKQQACSDFLNRCKLSDKSLETLINPDTAIDEAFFVAFDDMDKLIIKAQAFMSDPSCYQTLGNDILSKNFVVLEIAFERLCNFVLLSMKGLEMTDEESNFTNTLSPDTTPQSPYLEASPSAARTTKSGNTEASMAKNQKSPLLPTIRKALSLLKARPRLFNHCANEIAKVRKHRLLQNFHNALSKGNPSLHLNPIEMHAYDPFRFVGDMLAWIHEQAVAEKEFVWHLFPSVRGSMAPFHKEPVILSNGESLTVYPLDSKRASSSVSTPMSNGPTDDVAMGVSNSLSSPSHSIPQPSSSNSFQQETPIEEMVILDGIFEGLCSPFYVRMEQVARLRPSAVTVYKFIHLFNVLANVLSPIMSMSVTSSSASLKMTESSLVVQPMTHVDRLHSNHPIEVGLGNAEALSFDTSFKNIPFHALEMPHDGNRESKKRAVVAESPLASEITQQDPPIFVRCLLELRDVFNDLFIELLEKHALKLGSLPYDALTTFDLSSPSFVKDAGAIVEEILEVYETYKMSEQAAGDEEVLAPTLNAILNPVVNFCRQATGNLPPGEGSVFLINCFSFLQSKLIVHAYTARFVGLFASLIEEQMLLLVDFETGSILQKIGFSQRLSSLDKLQPDEELASNPLFHPLSLSSCFKSFYAMVCAMSSLSFPLVEKVRLRSLRSEARQLVNRAIAAAYERLYEHSVHLPIQLHEPAHIRTLLDI